jgi:hypothetical protein
VDVDDASHGLDTLLAVARAHPKGSANTYCVCASVGDVRAAAPLEMAAAGAGAGASVGEGKKRGASRSWILFDEAGEERVLDADKYAIMHRVDINARDLRILDPLLSYPSTILRRERAIVLNLEVRSPFAPSASPILRCLYDPDSFLFFSCSELPIFSSHDPDSRVKFL